MIDIQKKAIAIHRRAHGKLRIESSVPSSTREELSLIYTPGVAAVSSLIHKNPSRVSEFTIKHNTVAVISDGSAVLGLGNIGPEAALPVLEGKCVLFKKFAGINAFPIALATQDPEKIIETVKMIAPVFGGINLEDISAPRCFLIEERLKRELDIPVMHDDQHGTAIVVLAGLINTARVLKKDILKLKIVINGAGAAGTAVANLLKRAGVRNIIILDSKGIIAPQRHDLDLYKKELAKKTNPEKRQGGLAVALEGADVFIGVSKGNILTPEHIAVMGQKPAIFALANPTPEIMPELAHKSGAVIVATGRSDFPNQINNALGFPGIFRGAFDNGIKKITDDMKLKAAFALANLVKKPTANNIIPSLFDKRVVKTVASVIQ